MPAARDSLPVLVCLPLIGTFVGSVVGKRAPASFQHAAADFGSSIKDMVKRHTMAPEVPSEMLVGLQHESIREERLTAAFVLDFSRSCETILIDVGTGKHAKAMLTSVYIESRLGERCAVCAILLLSQTDATHDAKRLQQELVLRGVKLLVLRGAAGTGYGLEPQPFLAKEFAPRRRGGGPPPNNRTQRGIVLRRATDIAQIVHTVARHARPSQRLVLRLDAGREANAELVAHLVLSQAFCRLHSVLLTDDPSTRDAGGAGGASAAGAAATAAAAAAAGAAAALDPGRAAARAWDEWTRTAARQHLPQTAGARGAGAGRPGRPIDCFTQIVHLAAPGYHAASSLSAAAGTAAASAPMADALPSCASSGTRTPPVAPAESAEPLTPIEVSSSDADLLALHRLASEDEARLDALFAEHNCTSAYLDVGSNIGVQIRKVRPRPLACSLARSLARLHLLARGELLGPPPSAL